MDTADESAPPEKKLYKTKEELNAIKEKVEPAKILNKYLDFYNMKANHI